MFCVFFLELFFGAHHLLIMIPYWIFAVGIIGLMWQEEKVCKSPCWLIRTLAWQSQPWQISCSELFCCFMYCMFCFCSLRKVSVYSDSRWGLQIHFCFTSELGETLSYNWFSAGGIDHPRVVSIVWKKIAVRLLVSWQGFSVLNLYCCDYSAKPNCSDWYRHNTMY